MIYQTLQYETKARGARKINIVNIGLKKRRPVADYVRERTDRAPNNATWEDWLQTHRIELNTLNPKALIALLDGVVKKHGPAKLVPPENVTGPLLDGCLRDEIRRRDSDAVLPKVKNQIEALEAEIAELKRQHAEAVEEMVEQQLAKAKVPQRQALAARLSTILSEKPASPWQLAVELIADDILK
jgi:hypothetical protein